MSKHTVTDATAVLNALVEMFNEIDTPELRDICGEDEWIRRQRGIYRRVRKSLDYDMPLTHLFVNAVEDEALKGSGK